jgi:hypothetical protein
MVLRSALFACAAAMIAASATPAFAETPAARCEDTSFRIYFSHGAASLDETAMQMLSAAERNVAGCAYAELHVTLDASSPRAHARGEAIMAAASGRAWDAVRIEPRSGLQRAAYDAAPDYAEVTMSPNATSAAPIARTTDAGV